MVTSIPSMEAIQAFPPTTGFGLTGLFPEDLRDWVGEAHLVSAAQAAALRTCGGSWLNLLEHGCVTTAPDDRLTLIAYCYLLGIYPSVDVVRQLDFDSHLEPFRDRFALAPSQLRQFRREHRRALVDCLTLTLVDLWAARHPSTDWLWSNSLVMNRMNIGFLEPFHRHATERVERAVMLDSIALDD